MKIFVPALFAALLASAPLHAETTESALDGLARHGYDSAAAAIARIGAANDFDDPNLPIALRRRAAAGRFALALHNRDLAVQHESMRRLEAMAERENCTPCRASWLITRAHAAIGEREPETAARLLQSAEALITPDDSRIRLELDLAQIRLDRSSGALTNAYRKAIQAMPLAESLGNAATRAELMFSAGVMEADLGFLDRAQATLADAEHLARQIGFRAGVAQALLSQSYVYASTDQREKQHRVLEEVLKITAGAPALRPLEATAHANLSDYFLVRKNFPRALTEAETAEALLDQNGDQHGVAVAVANQGIALAGLGREDDGLELLRRALAIAKQTTSLYTEASVNRELVALLESTGRYREALEARNAMDEINRRITRQERDSTVLELQARYDDERKNREIERLSAEARLKAVEAEARRWQQSLWATLATLAVLFASLVILRLKHARSTNRKLVRDVADLAEQSATDELTGAMNRRSFASLMQRPTGETDLVALAMIDIDHFKQVNDQYGHDAGDAVLIEVTRRMHDFGRGRDCVVRWGGEEFVLAFANATPHGLPELARRLLESISSQPFDVAGRMLYISVSAGLTVHPMQHGSSWEQTLRLADAAMYLAKRRGRNRAIAVVSVRENFHHHQIDLGLDTALEAGTIGIAEVEGPAVSAAQRLQGVNGS